MRQAANDPSVHQNVQVAMEALLSAVNATLEHHERLQFIVIVAESWQIESGFLTQP
ncbi:MAG: hypothetical protein R3A47_10410 [Polyangiales bacterium]